MKTKDRPSIKESCSQTNIQLTIYFRKTLCALQPSTAIPSTELYQDLKVKIIRPREEQFPRRIRPVGLGRVKRRGLADTTPDLSLPRTTPSNSKSKYRTQLRPTTSTPSLPNSTFKITSATRRTQTKKIQKMGLKCNKFSLAATIRQFQMLARKIKQIYVQIMRVTGLSRAHPPNSQPVWRCLEKCVDSREPQAVGTGSLNRKVILKRKSWFSVTNRKTLF